MSTPHTLLENNRAWAKEAQASHPDLFSSLAEGQAPNVLWIGCADSRVPPDRIVDVPPGSLFVHRNIANVVTSPDPNGLSVLQYAVDVLEVEHVVVCGHYQCGGVHAVLQDGDYGLMDTWLEHVRAVRDAHEEQLRDLTDEDTRWNRLCELNVAAQVANVCRTSIIQAAWARGQSLAVHGWIYRIADGRLHDLKVSVTGPEGLEAAGWSLTRSRSNQE